MAGSENEPANSSSSAEEEEEEDVSSESESTPPPSSKKTQPSSDESDDDTPENPQLPDPSIKPLASNPMDHDDHSKKPRSKHPASRYSPPPLKGKRSAAAEADAAAAGDVKRTKKAATVVAVAAPDADNCGEKKQLFQRLWSEDNEIELIQGMINYVMEKGKDPLADVNGFYEFVKRSLHVDVNDRQVLTKARRLKKKFQDNAARVESKGKVRSFSKPHEKKMYDLSKSLWGDDNGSKSAVMSACSKKVKVKVNVTPKTNKSHNKSAGVGSGNPAANDDAEPKLVQAVRSGFGLMGLPITDEVIINKGLELVLGPKKVEMEEKWRNLKVLELEHFLKKVDVLKEQAEIVLNAIAKSGTK